MYMLLSLYGEIEIFMNDSPLFDVHHTR